MSDAPRRVEIWGVCSFYFDDHVAVNFVGCSRHNQHPTECARQLQAEVDSLRKQADKHRDEIFNLKGQVEFREKEMTEARDGNTKLAAWLRLNHPEIFKRYFLEISDKPKCEVCGGDGVVATRVSAMSYRQDPCPACAEKLKESQ